MGAIVYLTNMERQYTRLEEAKNDLRGEGLIKLDSHIFMIDENSVWNTKWQNLVKESKLTVISWMGTSQDNPFLIKAAAFLRDNDIVHTMLVTDPLPDDSSSKVTDGEQNTMRTYLQYSGMDNYRNFWLWLYNSYCGENCRFDLPQPLLWNGIFHPRSEKIFTDAAEYKAEFCLPERMTAGILFSRDEWIWGDLDYQTALIEELESNGLNAVAIFSYWANDPELKAVGTDVATEKYFQENGSTFIDVLINATKFSLTVGRQGRKVTDTPFLEKLNVPVLQAYTLLRPQAEWREDISGLTPIEVSINLALPEFDGIIHAVPMAAKEELADGAKQYKPIAERMNLVVRKAKKWALLRHKANSEKKIAVIFHNYPATNSNIGSAQGLDSPESVRLLLQTMAAEGYLLEHIPPDSQTLINELIKQSTNDRRFITDEQIRNSYGKISAREYQNFFHTLAPATKERLTNDWGEPPGEIFNYDGALLVPGMLNGNVFITVQPPRGFGEDAGKILHSPDAAPTHHYLAYYHWVRDIWQADAVVHVGTHGSLEWLPGKGSGLSRQCYPDISLGDLPDIYPYLITIVGEGIQAKRRGAACLIGHLPPPMSHADTYDELFELEKLMDEYCHFKITQPENADVVAELIREKATEANLQDIARTDEPFDIYLERLHAYLTDIKNMQIRTGLHIIGKNPSGDMLVEYLLALTRLENGEIPSLPQVIATVYGYDYYELFEKSSQLLPDGSKTFGRLLDEIRECSREFIIRLMESGFSDEKTNWAAEFPWIKNADKQRQEGFNQIARYICRTLAPNLGKTVQEITNIIAALRGEYIEPGPAGAPTSGMADILPTGRNFYGVDPRTLPTKAAWELGKTLGDGVVERYIAEEGRYPETVGIILFCGSNLRSRGQCLAEFYYLLGVRPVWQRGSQRVADLEVIPLSELKRPRIDVTARISGMLRDAFPMIIQLLDKAIQLVAELDESPEINYIRKHVLEDASELEKAGADREAAWRDACYRIFGDPPGAYGAGVSHLLEEKNWETVEDIGKTYIRWGAHAYGNKAQGVFVPELFTRRMGSIDVTVKNEDNREVHMLNADDFNSYHGGMIAAVRSIKGSAPRSYCGDSSDRKNAVVRSLGEEIKRLFRGEVMNPKYIEGMKKHGYKGAADLAGIVAHCYEWDATSMVIDDWMYDSLAQKYALDEDMQKWMKEVNPWALSRIAEKLLEASQRGLWQTDENILQELRDLYLSIEGDLEEGSD